MKINHKIYIAIVLTIWLITFVVGHINIDHGKITTIGHMTSIECESWSVGIWKGSTCENVTTKMEQFEDGHMKMTVIKREIIEPDEDGYVELK